MHVIQVELLQMKAQVEELWCNGMRVICGFITKETKVSFRSSTAQVSDIFLIVAMQTLTYIIGDY